GYCAGYDAPGYANPLPGRGLGMGRRFGWGRGGGRGWWGRGYGRRQPFYETMPPAWTPPTREQEIASLQAEAGWLKEQLDAIMQRLSEIGATKQNE
ncbi:MAG: DUF5320 domain-containing protein, partial [Anaerolineae bacterium]|nr:DUF5320 domain-containing protein [Anaerolineae bacterium]